MPTVRDVTEDLAVAGLAGYVGTKAMEPVSMALYERESEHAKQQEDAARPGPPTRSRQRKSPAGSESTCMGPPWTGRRW